MERVSMIGIDLAKNSFQAHGARADGSVAFRRKLSRAKILDFVASQPRCTVVMEACASAHYWGREIGGLGHAVRLIPPVYVKAYVKRQKNDAADAEAICEAASRPTMSFVAVKTKEQQARGMLFRTRDLLVRQRTQTINALRGHLAEFGVVAPKGPVHIHCLASALEDQVSDLPEAVCALGGLLFEQIEGLNGKIGDLEREIHTAARQDEDVQRLMTVPGIGPITAMAIQAFAPPMESFQRGRDFCLAGPRTAPAHDRRQAEIGQDIEDGSARSSAAADHGRHGGCPLVGPAWQDRRSVARQDAGVQAADACRSGAGQPDGAYRLGADDEEGDLPGSRARSRLRGWQSAGSRRGCGQVGGQARANGRRDGIGKTSFARRAFELA